MPAAVSTHRYRLFGLELVSDLALPELYRSDGRPPADVTVSLTDGPLVGDNVWTIDEVAAFRITNGRTIDISPAAKAAHAEIRPYLLGSAFGVLLQQRGVLPLHANCVLIDGNAVAFCGETGAGKSTIAAWLSRHGCTALSDDLCAVQIDEVGHPNVLPGIARVRLWDDGIALAGMDPTIFRPTAISEEGRSKFEMALSVEDCRDAMPLRAIVMLDEGPDNSLLCLNGVEAFESLFANTFRGALLADAGDRKAHWNICVGVAKSTPVLRWARRRSADEFGTQAAEMLSRLRSMLVR